MGRNTASNINQKLSSVTFHKTKLAVPGRGVVEVGAPATEEDFKGFPDPLSRAGAQANKPGSSIPTIFARMLFFSTAFTETILSDTISEKTTVYNRIVSQCLDLLEMIFNNDPHLHYVKWDPAEQNALLKKTSGHEELAKALEVHFQKFLAPYGISDITLVIDRRTDSVAGGTSPFTMVFTSPNWNSGKQIVPLYDRDPKFREYVYRLYAAVENSVTDKEAIKGFLEYVKKCASFDTDRELRGIVKDKGYSIGNLNSEYPAVEVDNVDILVASFDGHRHDIYLSARPQGAIESDFFVDSDVREFDVVATPLIVAKGQYHNMNYHDGIHWNDSTSVAQEELDRLEPRELPGAPGVKHVWLTTVDFLQDTLIKLPYRIDEKNFYDAINGKSDSYLLPVKPRLFEFFSIDKVREMLSFSFGDEQNGEPQTLTVSLRMPVRSNDGSEKNFVELMKVYNLNSDVVDLMHTPVAVGITPFLRIPEGNPQMGENLNRYWVVLQHQPVPGFEETELRFFSVGDSKPLENVADKIRGRNPGAKYYTLKKTAFDAVQLCLMCERGDKVAAAAGMMLPKFQIVNDNGNQKYFYSVDFGTTNTHIAFAKESGDPQSFGSPELRHQAVYLAAVPKAVEDADNYDKRVIEMEKVFGFQGTDIKQSLERQFYPYGIEDQFTFPIRTVTGEENPLVKAESQVYSGASIGFRYPKELVDPEGITYFTDVKWQFENVSSLEGGLRADLFFREILEMIRTHWLSRKDALLSRKDAKFAEPPYIIFTFPLAMVNRTNVIRKWREQYATVFEVDAAQASRRTLTMFESLAPAYNLIYKGSSQSDGILNVDIGGGTTDIQYYRKSGSNEYAFYNSVRFAGDDLWGTGYENIPNAPGQGVKDNVFTDFAAEKLREASLFVDINSKKLPEIKKTGKELVNILLRDREESFMVALKQPTMEMARKVLFIHYGALIHHIVGLIRSQPEATGGKFPKEMNFTGFGSKYIDALFGDDRDNLRSYTRSLIEAFGMPADAIRNDFRINFSENPKNATAEGAVLFGRDRVNGNDAVKPDTVVDYGYEVADGEEPRYDQLENNIDRKVFANFEKFVDDMQKAAEKYANVPSLTQEEKDRLLERARTSFNDVRSSTVDPKDDRKKVTDSMFFWNLKGSLYNLHKS